MRNALLALAAATVIVGCSGDDKTPTQPAPTISLAVSTSTPTIAAGGSPANITVSVARSTGLTAPITLTAEGLPTGVVATFVPATVPSDASSSVLTLTAVSSVPVGNTTFTIRAKGGNAPDATQQVTLSVTAAAVVGVSFTTGADSLVVRQGDSTTVAVRLTRRGGYTSPVAFAIDSLPAGVTATFTPVSPVAADSTVLKLKVAPTFPAGTYALRLRSTATGQSDSTKVLRLIVNASGAISVSAVGSGLTIVQGDSGVATLVVRRTAPYAGTVTITADSASAVGLNLGALPLTLSAATDTARIMIKVDPTTALGTRNVQFNAAGTGVARATTSFPVLIQPRAGIAFTTTPDSVIATQGGFGQLRIAITRTGGFTGPVTFTADTIPAGVTALFTPASPVAGDSTTLVLSTLSSVAPGTYQVSIVASGAGVAAVRRVVRIRVNATGAISAMFTRPSAPLAASRVFSRPELRRDG